MPTCFVIMGYGEKTDFATGRKLNLDSTYKNIIKPSVQASGYECIRADEIRHSGLIDVPMYDMLFDADLVIADLSTSNVNAVFELGIRHAFKPRSTIVIAEKQFTSPFDINHIVIRKYEHLGSDIGFGETMRMRDDLQRLIVELGQTTKPDSPVYTLLDLVPPIRQKTAKRQADPALRTVEPDDSYATQVEKAMNAKSTGGFAEAHRILKDIYEAQTTGQIASNARTPRPRIVQELALATYKTAEKRDPKGDFGILDAAYDEALELLAQLDPERTTDPETLGLWSAIHKRIAERAEADVQRRKAHLDTAIFSSERGFLIRQDYYTGTNLAYLLDYRAFYSSGDEKIADRVLADRVRSRTIGFIEAGLKSEVNTREDVYWLKASLGEAKIALGRQDAQQALRDAKDEHARSPKLPDWMLETTLKQIGQLAKLRHGG
ncbi:DUF4071 domain-containing protein [Rhizobium leguminosarum]|nr:DUF4071 domain-containing protein [Rhizobium leguminosarum]